MCTPLETFLNFINLNVHWWIKFIKFSVTEKIIYVHVNEMFKFVVTENLNILKNTNWKMNVLVKLFIKFNAHVHYVKKIWRHW